MKLLIALFALASLFSANAAVANISCPGFDRTIVVDAKIPAPSERNQQYFTSRLGGWGAKTAFVFKFVAPTSSSFGFSAVMSSGSSSSFHAFSLATEPCLWDKADPRVKQANLDAKTAFTVSMATVPPAKNARVRGVMLEAGKTYYLTTSHKTSRDGWACKTTCDMLFTVTNTNW